MPRDRVLTCYKCSYVGDDSELYPAKLIYRWKWLLYACRDKKACLDRWEESLGDRERVDAEDEHRQEAE